jgi:hypothetical protein
VPFGVNEKERKRVARQTNKKKVFQLPIQKELQELLPSVESIITYLI